MASCCYPIDTPFERVQCILYGNGTFAKAEKRVIVLSVSNTDHVMARKSEFQKRCVQSRRLVHTGWQDHDRTLIEDHLKLEAKVAVDFHRDRFARAPCRNDDPAGRHALGAAPHEFSNKFLRWRLRQQRLLAGGWPVQQGSVFRHDPVEQFQFRKDADEVFEFSSGDENQLAAGLPNLLKSLDGTLVNPSVPRNGSVVIAG